MFLRSLHRRYIEYISKIYRGNIEEMNYLISMSYNKKALQVRLIILNRLYHCLVLLLLFCFALAVSTI
jgi:hypothetical protein